LSATNDEIKSLGPELFSNSRLIITKTGLLVLPGYEEEDELPQVNAGEDISTCVGSRVALDGSNTYDPKGIGFEYDWFFYSKPNGSNATIRDRYSVNPSFIPDIAGQYYITVQVKTTDGRLGSDTVSVNAEDCTSTPVISLKMATTGTVGAEIEVTADISVIGAQSDVAGYSWVLVRPLGSYSGLSKNAGVDNTFIPDKAGVYTVRLKVWTKNRFESEWSEANIIVYDALPPDIAIFGNSYQIGGVYIKAQYVILDIVVEHLSGKRLSKAVLYRRQNGDIAEYVKTYLTEDQSGEIFRFTYEEQINNGDVEYIVVGYCNATPVVTKILLLKGGN
jgi:hypothetical protein